MVFCRYLESHSAGCIGRYHGCDAIGPGILAVHTRWMAFGHCALGFVVGLAVNREPQAAAGAHARPSLATHRGRRIARTRHYLTRNRSVVYCFVASLEVYNRSFEEQALEPFLALHEAVVHILLYILAVAPLELTVGHYNSRCAADMAQEAVGRP